MDIRSQIKNTILDFLQLHAPQFIDLIYSAIIVAWMAVVWITVYFMLHRVVRLYLKKIPLMEANFFDILLFKYSLFSRVALVIQGWVISLQATFWLSDQGGFYYLVTKVAGIWMLVFTLLAFFSIANSVHHLLQSKRSMAAFPLKGLFQTFKLIAVVLFCIAVFSVVLNKSPIILFSGLGAISAVLLLVFKDPILGLVSGVQLSANRMLSVGDWLEMPKYNADGDVLDISLTTVKVQNWDKTITTIPTYALISESFKNWRGMSESGGRRIKRSIFIEAKTVRFLQADDISRLNKANVLTGYLAEKVDMLEQENRLNKTDLSSLLNGRRLTNLGTLRAYLVAYLHSHPKIHTSMTLLVRQLAPTPHGLPLEIYAFTNTTNWNEYENIQSDLFDHIVAVVGEFDLRIHEAPTGSDILALKH